MNFYSPLCSLIEGNVTVLVCVIANLRETRAEY